MAHHDGLEVARSSDFSAGEGERRGMRGGVCTHKRADNVLRRAQVDRENRYWERTIEYKK